MTHIQQNLSGPLPATKPTRFPGLDWLRAGATVGVVALHAGIPYVTHPFPGLVWSTRDTHPSPILDAITWNINVWVMPLFFLLSGYLAAGLLERLGATAFTRHRLLRIGGPLLFAMVFVLPIDLYAWLLSWVNQGWVEPVKLKSLKVQGSLGEGMWGLSHLWYLEYLLIYSLAAAGIMAWRSESYVNQHLLKFDTSMRFRSSRAAVLGTVCLLGVAWISLWVQPRIVIGFRHSFFPQLANLVFFACWFSLGWLRQGWRNGLGRLTACGFISASLLTFPFLLGLIHYHVLNEATPASMPLLPLLYVATAWLAASGLFELSLHGKRMPPRSVSLIAEASFWIYLVHHPVVGLAQGNMAPLGWPVWLKYTIAFAVGLAFPLLTYTAFVKESWVGLLLNGRKATAKTAPQTQVQSSGKSDRKAA